ncbi:MAG: dTMP kinase [Frankiales bacterium]|nr:dTMP kinase [Frankiales bacterium]
MTEVAAAPPSEAEVRHVLALKPFRRLWISLSLSSLGDWLGFLATTSLAQQLVGTYSAKLYAIGGVLFVRLLPALVIGPLAGVWADRFNRRTTMVVTDVIRFGLFISIPLLQTLWWLFAASFLIECASLFWIPAKEASIPNLVPRNRLESANQLALVTTYGFGAVAAVVFSALSFVNRVLAHEFSFFRTNPVNLALYLDALTFLVSGLTILGLSQLSSARPRDLAAQGAQQPGLLASLREGLTFVGGARWLRGLVLGVSGATAAGAAVIGLSRVFADDLHGGNAAYGVLFGTVFVGLASGMFLGPRVIGNFPRRRAVGVAIMCSGVALAINAVVPNLALAVVMTGLLGFFAGIVWVVSLTLVGSEVADELRGRTFAFIYNLMRVVLLVAVAAAPFLAGVIGPHTITVQNAHVRVDGVTVTLFVAGVLAIAAGAVCLQLMDDRRDVPLRTDVLAALLRRDPEQGRGTRAGYFLALEGGEGAGKSTLARSLAAELRDRGYEVLLTFEPGDTAVGARIRAVLLDPASDGMSPRTEAMLYAADRAQHVTEVIRPALERNAIVVCDRYVDSSRAYQGGGRALDDREISHLSRWATSGLQPDLTVLLDIDPDEGLRRASRVGESDRLEAEAVEFHRRVRAEFLTLARRGRHRYLVVDAAEEPNAILERVLSRLDEEALPDLPAGRTTMTIPLAEAPR